MTFEIVEGWTGDLDFVLKSGSPPAAVDLTGMTVTLILKTANGTTIDTTSDVTVPTPSAGVVRYSPDAADLVATNSPLSARWKVVDGSGKVVYFPGSKEPDRWEVGAP